MTGLLLALLTASPDDKNAAAAAAAQEAMAAAQKLQDAKRKSEQVCAVLENKPVGQYEEQYVGKRFAAARMAKLVDGPRAEYVQRIGASLAGASSRKELGWTFAIIEDGEPWVSSEMGGWVFISSGMFGHFSDESELAAALAHEIAHVTTDRVAIFSKARAAACRTALTGYALTEAGASSLPGGDAFVRQAKFGETMRAFAERDGVAMYEGPNVDQQYVTWFLSQVMQMERLDAQPDLELAADALAVQLLAAAGYDTHGVAKVARVTDRMYGQRRVNALEKLPQQAGKHPRIPAMRR